MSFYFFLGQLSKEERQEKAFPHLQSKVAFHLCFSNRIMTRTDNTNMLGYILMNTSIQRLNFICVLAPKKLNPFPNKPWFLRACSTSLLKTLWEKKKLLVTSNFFFSHSGFYPFRDFSAIFIEFKLSSANSLSLGDSKIQRLGKA